MTPLVQAASVHGHAASRTYSVPTTINIVSAGEYGGGILQKAGANFSIVGNTAGANATVYTFGNPGEGNITIYQDDFSAPNVLRANAQSEAGLYDFMQVTTVRANNRYADAYLEPEYTKLDEFDRNDVTSVGHWSVGYYDAVINPMHRGSKDVEKDVFWIVYVSTAYEYERNQDNDPNGEADSRVGDTYQKQISMIFVETTRDGAVQAGITEAEGRARVTTHEVGHQFGLVVEGRPGATGTHRNDGANIMDLAPLNPALANYYFHVQELADLRMRRSSPGPNL